MKIKICFFDGTFEINFRGRKETYRLTKQMWQLIDWLTDNGWETEVLPATVLLHFN